MARSAWAGDELHFFRRGGAIVARLVWKLLLGIEDADQVVLEMISQNDHGFRLGPEEVGLELIAYRPPMPMSANFEWFVRQLATRDDEYESPIPVGPICELLLVEADVESPMDHLGGLIDLHREMDWGYSLGSSRGLPSQRAEAILMAHIHDDNSANSVQSELSDVILNPKGRSEYRRHRQVIGAAKLLLSIGKQPTPDCADAIISTVVERWPNDSDVEQWVIALAAERVNHEWMAPRLKAALSSEEDRISENAGQVLKAIGLQFTPKTKQDGTVQNCDDSVADCFADDLWADPIEERDRVWHAAEALMKSRRTDAAGLPRAFVRAGLALDYRRAAARDYLTQLAATPEHQNVTVAALLDGLSSEDDAVATGAIASLDEKSRETGEFLAFVGLVRW